MPVSRSKWLASSVTRNLVVVDCVVTDTAGIEWRRQSCSTNSAVRPDPVHGWMSDEWTFPTADGAGVRGTAAVTVSAPVITAMNHAGPDMTLVPRSAQKTTSQPAIVRFESHFESRREPRNHRTDPYVRPATVGSQNSNGWLLSTWRCTKMLTATVMRATPAVRYRVALRSRCRVVSPVDWFPLWSIGRSCPVNYRRPARTRSTAPGRTARAIRTGPRTRCRSRSPGRR